VQYKPEQNVHSLGFGEQMSNLAHRFVNDRWKEMHPEINVEHEVADTDDLNDKLSFIHDLIKTKDSKGKTKLVKEFIKAGQHKLAKAHCLYFCNMNVEKVITFIIVANLVGSTNVY
jgi:hypothetical protein